MVTDILEATGGGVVSVIGAGGKTTLMFKMATELASQGKSVLVSTTTKIFVPRANQYGTLCIGAGMLDAVTRPSAGVCVAGGGVNHRGKLTPPNAGELQRAAARFDVTLLEADGARERRLKAWADHEPSIPPYTTVTVVVFNLGLTGRLPHEDDIHRLPLFLRLCQLAPDEPITHRALVTLLTAPNGALKNARGKRVLYINHLRDNADRHAASDFAEKFAAELSCFDHIVTEQK